MVELKIPVEADGRINFSRLEFKLGSIFCNDPENTFVDLIGNKKSSLREVRDNYLQSSFDYRIIKVGKIRDNYLIKIGVKK